MMLRLRRSRTFRIASVALGGLLLLLGCLAVVGSTRDVHVITVSRTTTAPPEAVWQLFADVPRRTRWDEGLEWARIDGPFARGTTGELKLEDQPVRRFEIIECEVGRRYTDRFFLPAGTHMDWEHRISEHAPGERLVTFRVTVRGPSAVQTALIARRILEEELPPTVDKLVALAEQAGGPTDAQ